VNPEKDQESLVPRECFLVIILCSNEWLPRLIQGETFFLVHVVRVELGLHHLLNDGFLGQDTGVI
jgi:hypothetical protein